MVSGSLSLPSRGSFHLSLTVLFSIGHQVVFSLGRWASRLPTEFLVLHGTLLQIASPLFRLQGFYLVSPGFPRRFVYVSSCTSLPQNISASLLGSYPFARHYLGNRWFTFSSSGYLDGSVPRVPLLTLCVHVRIPDLYFGCVPAFGYLRIYVCLRLPAAFRSLPRPSSAPDAIGILHTLFIALIFVYFLSLQDKLSSHCVFAFRIYLLYFKIICFTLCSCQGPISTLHSAGELRSTLSG